MYLVVEANASTPVTTPLWPTPSGDPYQSAADLRHYFHRPWSVLRDGLGRQTKSIVYLLLFC